MDIGIFFNEVFIRPILNVLVAIYQLLFLLHIPYSLGFAIIILTILIRFIMYPLITAQLRTSKKMQDLAPHLSKVKEKHKGDAAKLQQETMRLYKEHGVNPAAGCLPALIQIPIIWALYSVLQKVVGFSSDSVVAHVNQEVYLPFLRLSTPWDQYFFGLPLGQNPSNLLSNMPLILLIPLLTGFFQFIQSKMMMVSKPKDAPLGEKKEDKQGDFASAFQTQSLYIFPVMIGFFSYGFPIGLSLYWNTFTIFGILQQHRVSGLGALAQDIERIWVKKKKE